MDSETKQLCLQQFFWAVQALAQPVDVQLRLFPDHVVKADELGLDFGHWQECLLTSGDPINDEQRKSLGLLDDYLTSMGGTKNENLWTEEALAKSDEWQRVRQLARNVLDSFNWTNEPPPFGRSQYSSP